MELLRSEKHRIDMHGECRCIADDDAAVDAQNALDVFYFEARMRACFEMLEHSQIGVDARGLRLFASDIAEQAIAAAGITSLRRVESAGLQIARKV